MLCCPPPPIEDIRLVLQKSQCQSWYHLRRRIDLTQEFAQALDDRYRLLILTEHYGDEADVNDIECPNEHLWRVFQDVPRVKADRGERSGIQGCCRGLIETYVETVEVVGIGQLLGYVEEPAPAVRQSDY